MVSIAAVQTLKYEKSFDNYICPSIIIGIDVFILLVSQESRSFERTNLCVQRHKQRRNTSASAAVEGSHCHCLQLFRSLFLNALFFQIIYQQVLTLDLEYALDQKVEQDLWNHGFKNNINKLQQLAKDKKVLFDFINSLQNVTF